MTMHRSDVIDDDDPRKEVRVHGTKKKAAKKAGKKKAAKK
jgi:hypothetical protein